MFLLELFLSRSFSLGVTLAITRDGSSGGCARLAIINKDGVERIDVLGNDLPKVFDL
jgi:20S proteasome subunit beta 1